MAATAPTVAPALVPVPGAFSVNLGHRQYSATNTGKKLNGWFYLQGNYPEAWIPYDDPKINQFYTYGTSQCPSQCHVCIPILYTLVGNNSCLE